MEPVIHETTVKTKTSALRAPKTRWNFSKNWPLHILVLPAVILGLLFHYGPLPGMIMAFQEYKPWLGFGGSEWVGLDNFKRIFEFSETRRVISNTLVISSFKIVFSLIVPLVFALLLNEVRISSLKRTIQTLVYLPHFLSWVILGGILIDILSVKGGIVNQALGFFGIGPVFFLGDNQWFVFTLITSDLWKEFGFSAIVFLAALSGVNPSLYEASVIDGANRLQQVWYITLPAIIPIVIVVATLSLGQILNAGFDQVFNLYNPLVYESGDIIDTYVYRVGLLGGQFSFATAVGMFKSVIGFILIITGYYLAYRFANYRIF
ncbi:polysaccharide ABC transporter permease [Paenibacillus algicola]|uniref:Polysaccharide ABC transporter permease n=1 Tax=Paenibacillus algicola TaxID=2565926 RepID=A0A4P8XK09_9BACL|nr:ABC transporter permease subunit [Paenibacillus algicola]QCT01731.1 polysaccharide ABC transporter permease [Paenibacillus algicola]